MMAAHQHHLSRSRRAPAVATLTTLYYISSAVLVILFVFSLTRRLPDREAFIHSGSPQWPHWTHSSDFLLTQTVPQTQLRMHGLRRLPTQVGVLPKDMVWSSQYARFYRSCSQASSQYSALDPHAKSNGYLQIQTSGGLNQQRIGIADAVVVARILNATLVVPELDHESFWKDDSDFGDLFDADSFISSLARDVRIVKELPSNMSSFSMRVPRKSDASFYLTTVLPVLRERQVLKLTKFDFRLANTLDTELQKLRCRANYEALQFTPAIVHMGQSLVEKMRAKSGRFIAVHLRFEPDMLAFSGCYYGGGEKEIRELGKIRKRWHTLHVKHPDSQRRNGKCPLSPLEVGMMLQALGFSSDSYLYVASGEVYGGHVTLAPLKTMFPNFFTKDTLASNNELLPFSSHTSQLAAIDYVVCDQSDVFVTNNNGNMAQVLAGRRRYFGHKKTIRPNARKLGQLFLDRQQMTLKDFSKKLQNAQKGFMGEPMEVRPGKAGFHEYPAACICPAFPGAQEEMEALKKKGLPVKQTVAPPPDPWLEDEDGETEDEWESGEIHDPQRLRMRERYREEVLDQHIFLTDPDTVNFRKQRP